MSFFQRPTPPLWRIILYCLLSVAVLFLLGKIGAFLQIGG